MIFNDAHITIESGDVFVSDFSKTMHGVHSIIECTSPIEIANILKKRAMLSVQIRYVDSQHVKNLKKSFNLAS